MAKNIRFGWAAHDAILACMLARNGFTGPRRVIEADTGIRNMIANGEMDLERLIEFSGWRILDVIFKGLAANASTHGHVYATLGIVKEQNLKVEDIAAVHIKTSTRVARHTTTLAKKYPRTAENADHSAFYATAHAIKERGFGPDSIDPARFTDPVILDLIEKTTVEADPSLGKSQGISEIITTDGRTFQKRINVPHGAGDDPLSDQELEAKFTEMASKHMRADHVRKLIDACWNVEKIDDISKLAKLMVFQGVNT